MSITLLNAIRDSLSREAIVLLGDCHDSRVALSRKQARDILCDFLKLKDTKVPGYFYRDDDYLVASLDPNNHLIIG